jgi:hypothetical protein
MELNTGVLIVIAGAIGGIVAALIGFIKDIINMVFAERKERERWEREKEHERRKEETAEKKSLQTIYAKAASGLCKLSAARNDDRHHNVPNLSDDQLMNIYQSAFDSVCELAMATGTLHGTKHNDIITQLNYLGTDPHQAAQQILYSVVALSLADPRIALQPQHQTPAAQTTPQPQQKPDSSG